MRSNFNQFYSHYKWVIATGIMLISSATIGWLLSEYVPRFYPKARELPAFQSILFVLSITLGMIIEIMIWSMKTIHEFRVSAEKIILENVAKGAEKALSEYFIELMLPSAKRDPIAAKIHMDRVNDYLRISSSYNPKIQRASALLFEDSIENWSRKISNLVGKQGLLLGMNETANLSKILIQGGDSYLIVERDICDISSSWSPQFISFIEMVGFNKDIDTQFILLCSKEVLLSEQKRKAFSDECKILKRNRFKVLWCDEDKFNQEIGSLLPNINIEVFNDEVSLLMQASTVYSGELMTWVKCLQDDAELRKALRVIKALSVEWDYEKKRM